MSTITDHIREKITHHPECFCTEHDKLSRFCAMSLIPRTELISYFFAKKGIGNAFQAPRELIHEIIFQTQLNIHISPSNYQVLGFGIYINASSDKIFLQTDPQALSNFINTSS